MGQLVYKYFEISGAIVAKYLWKNVLTGHRGTCLQNNFIPYFRATGVKRGVKRSGKLQGTRIFRFGLLFLSQN